MKTIDMIKASLLWGGMLILPALNAQELYVFTEPASNMPAHSISARLSGKFVHDQAEDRISQRYSPEVMFGVNKRVMIHGAISLSDMYTDKLRFESARVYAKYRFYSKDEVHQHFRLAAYSEVSQSLNDVKYEELSLEGDQSGLQAGVIATQLLDKLAVSSTIGFTAITSQRPKINAGDYVYQGIGYSISAGYLLLPVEYRNFKQTNVNLYAELLGQRATDKSKYFVDLAPALQFIFNSNFKVNIGYRFQLAGDMYRMADRGFLVSVERTFLRR